MRGERAKNMRCDGTRLLIGWKRQDMNLILLLVIFALVNNVTGRGSLVRNGREIHGRQPYRPILSHRDVHHHGHRVPAHHVRRGHGGFVASSAKRKPRIQRFSASRSALDPVRDCGIRALDWDDGPIQPYIFFGSTLDIRQAPWAVNFADGCSGSIISDKWFLTGWLSHATPLNQANYS